MCDKCSVLDQLFKAAKSDSYLNYIPTLSFIREMLKQGRIELYAGDCPIDEVEKNLIDEEHYTIQHYFKCRNCNQYFYIGACVRGMPVFKIVDNIKTIDFNKMLWGRYGTHFQQS